MREKELTLGLKMREARSILISKDRLANMIGVARCLDKFLTQMNKLGKLYKLILGVIYFYFVLGRGKT